MSDSDNIYEEEKESIVLPEDENPFRNELKFQSNVKLGLTGTVTALEPDRAKTKFHASNEMVADRGLYIAVLYLWRLIMRR